MRGKGLGRLAAFAGLSGCALAGFAAVTFGLAAAPARGDVGLPLPTTTSVGITTSVPGVTVAVPTTTVRLPTTLPLPLPTTVPLPLPTTVPLPTTTAPLPTTVPPRTTVPPPPVLPPTTVATVTVPTTPSRPPVTTLPPPVSTTTVAGGGGGGTGPPGGGSAGGGSPPGTRSTGAASAGPSSQVPAVAGADVLHRSSGPALEAVKAGAKANRRGHAAKALGKQNAGPQALRTSRVALRSPGLAAFYAGLEKALARPAAPGDARIPAELWPAQRGDRGVLSRSGALALALALLALALLLGFAVVPRLAAARFLPASRSSVRLARESAVVTLGTAAICGFLALLLIRAAL